MALELKASGRANSGFGLKGFGVQGGWFASHGLGFGVCESGSCSKLGPLESPISKGFPVLKRNPGAPHAGRV